MHFASWVTWLEGVIPRASDRMCRLPPAIVSASWQNARIGHFGGQNTEATPYPSITAFHRCWGRFPAPKQRFRRRLPRHSPARAYAPFMVELFTAAGFANGPRTWFKVRLRLLPTWRLPTPAHVQRTAGPSATTSYRSDDLGPLPLVAHRNQRCYARSPWADLQPKRLRTDFAT